MPSGLVALLDDIAALTKLAAASLDDVAGAAGKAGAKAAGVVIDDTAVTPRYVVGLSPDRELPIIAKIARGSLKNKLLFLLPAALALSGLAPWAITPLLMLGGAYLCFEASEKISHAVFGGESHEEEVTEITDPKELEHRQVSGAIRTDFILSAEIMAIALADLPDRSLVTQGVILALVGIAITVGVYGVVALIVKMDDIGLHLAQRGNAMARMTGRGLVKAMPPLLEGLSIIGTAAMVWVGGGIIVHGLEAFGLTTIPHWVHELAEAAEHAAPFGKAIAAWIATAAASAIVGMLIGGVIVAAMHLWQRRSAAKPASPHS
jgi:predicted DNA repair protein MutK